MSAADFLFQLIRLGQRMRDDIRPADDDEGLRQQWDDLLAKVRGMKLTKEWQWIRPCIGLPHQEPTPAQKPEEWTARTDQEIVEQTNELARELYRIRGYIRPRGYRFDRATHPHEVEAWNGACEAQRMLTLTDPDEALMELEEEEDT